MHDPQRLSTLGSIKALVALGRIPLATEVPLWCFFGCLVSSQVFTPVTGLDWLATVQCMLVVWGTNISINYGNEYFDWDMDRPGMVAAIKRDVDKRRREVDLAPDQAGKARKQFGNEKIMGSTSRILHDGTFPAWVSLLCSAFVQALLVAMILVSRRQPHHTPFKGLALQIGILCTFLSQTYVGPPFRLHYHGLGEFVSALMLSPVAVLFGMVAHYTASTGKSAALADLARTGNRSGFHLDSSLWSMLIAFYFYEQARIYIMHIHDIDADRAGGKITLVVRIGYDWAKRLYVLSNLVSIAFFALFAWCMSQRGDIVAAAMNTKTVMAGLGVLAAFALPIMLVTARSLFYHSPSNHGKPHASTTVPVLPHAELAKLVSLQTLLSPVILSVTFAVAAW